MNRALTIAGSDCSGGAGIQADIKTMTALGVYAESVITALTAQNTQGVASVMDVPANFVAAQMDSVFSDIMPEAVKIGMLSNAEVVHVVAEGLKKYNAQNVVLDPVMVATSGAALSDTDAVRAIVSELLPLADVVTPNIPEAEALTGLEITGREGMRAAAAVLAEKGCKSVLIKGGHLEGSADDLFLTEHGREVWLEQKRINTPNTHGTGCTLSSAIAAYLAEGSEMQNAVQRAKRYLTGALKNDPGLGKGAGPLNHMWNMDE